MQFNAVGMFWDNPHGSDDINITNIDVTITHDEKDGWIVKSTRVKLEDCEVFVVLGTKFGEVRFEIKKFISAEFGPYIVLTETRGMTIRLYTTPQK